MNLRRTLVRALERRSWIPSGSSEAGAIPASSRHDADAEAEEANAPFPEIPCRQAIEDLSNRGCFDQDAATRLTELGSEVKTADLEQRLAEVESEIACFVRPLEACSHREGRLLAGVVAHPLLEALHKAFSRHRPLSLSPDAVWLLLCQGVAHHVHCHEEELRWRFFQRQGRVEIRVRRDEFLLGSPDNPWGEVIDEMRLQVRAEMGPAADLFVPRFSTTGPADAIAAEIVLLDAVQSCFDYSFFTACGIPEVKLEGTARDWEELSERARSFAEFGLGWWLDPLEPILEEFITAARGEVRSSFWKSIYKYESRSGSDRVTGWIGAFFPYLLDEQRNPTKANPWLRDGGSRLKRLVAGEWSGEGGECDECDLSMACFPGGLSRAPFTWSYYGMPLEMEFLGGFVGVSQDATTLTLRPEIGWAIRHVADTRRPPADAQEPGA